MIKVKKFFFNNRSNILNKGYDNAQFFSKRNALRDMLPMLDSIAQYEDVCPGILNTLLDLIKKEQSHKHTIDVMNIKMYKRIRRLGQFFGVFIIMLIGYFTLQIANISLIYSIIFAGMAFICIFLISVISYFKESSVENFYNKRKFNSKV